MREFATLLKLEFLSNTFRVKDGVSLFSRIKKIILISIGFLLIVSLLIFAISSIMDVCIKANLKQEFIVYYVLIVQVVQILFGLGLTTKTLYFKNDPNILKLPVKGRTLFLAKITYLFIYELIFSAVLTFPVFLIFGIKTLQPAIFYVLLLPNVLFFPIIPFLIALFLSVPTMYLVGYIKNKFIIMLILYIFFISLGFLFYVYSLKFILNILNSGDITDVFSSSTIFKIKQFSNYFILSVLYKNILLNYKFWQSLIINISIIFVLGSVILLFADKVYIKKILSNNEGGEKPFKKSTKIKQRNISGALFFREFTTIFRSTNYAFQYLTVVITTPLMVYFSSEIALNIGVSLIGEGILPGIIVLVLIMFLSMGSSFAATSITREGQNFFHTKIIPVSYKKQIFVKFFTYLFVSIPSIFVSCFILFFAGFIDIITTILIATSVSIIIIGNISKSILMDIKRPQFIYLDGGELTASTKNVNSSISIGFMIGTLMGIGCIALSFFVSIPSMYLALFGFGVPFAFYEVFKLFFKIENRYRRIEA